MADATRFNVGDILQIDQVADGTKNGPVGWVWILDSWWSLRSPYSDFSGGGGLQGKFPDSPNGYRPISQRIEVLAKSGNVLTIYDPGTRRGSPLHVDFPAAQDPEVWRAAGGTADVVRYTGLESLSVWSASNSGDAKDMVVMNGAAFSWIKDIETDGSKNSWAGRHIHIGNAVYKSELRGSYSHNSSNYNQGSNAYGILYSGSDCLIEDNIVRELNKPVVGETTGGGNVIAYNYVDEAIIGSLTNSWQETAINMSHASFCHSDLFEGNHTPNVGVDSTHGNNGWGVIFRNWATGRNGSGRTNTYLRAIYSDGWQREMTSIGNVLATPSFKPTYLILSPSTGVNPVYGGVSSVYLLGSNAWELSTGRKPGADYMDNGQAEDFFYRHLDFDYKSNTQYFNPSNPETTLPNSLYLTGKPAFFGSLPWPWVDPAGATKVHTLPAKARYDAMGATTYALTVTKAGQRHRHLLSRRHQLRRHLQRHLQLRHRRHPHRHRRRGLLLLRLERRLLRPRRLPGHHERRPGGHGDLLRPVALGRRPHRHRRQHRKLQRHLHRDPLAGRLRHRHRELRHRERHRHRRHRLHRHLGHPHLHRRPDQQDRRRPRPRRHRHRGERDLHRHPQLRLRRRRLPTPRPPPPSRTTTSRPSRSAT